MSDDASQIRRGAKCAICGKPENPEHRPFCSPRCRDIDLARWLGGTYRIAGDPAPIAEDDVED